MAYKWVLSSEIWIEYYRQLDGFLWFQRNKYNIGGWAYLWNENVGRSKYVFKCNCIMMDNWIYPRNRNNSRQNMSLKYNESHDRWQN